MIQEDIKESLIEVKDEFQTYINKRFDLIKLQIVEDLSKATSSFGLLLGLSYLFFFVLLFFSLAAAYFLGNILNSNSLGFMIIGSLFLLMAVIFYLLRHTLIEKPVIKSFIHLFFPKYDNDEK